MVNYPTILGLPQEDIDRQLYVGVLGLESRVKALENKPKPTPTGTGTVTVTCVDSEENPLRDSGVVLSTEPIDFSSQDDTGFVASGQTGTDGTATLNLWDTTTHQPTQDTDVPYGTYYFGGFNGDGIIKTYTGTLVVDGDEEVTITLTEQ